MVDNFPLIIYNRWEWLYRGGILLITNDRKYYYSRVFDGIDDIDYLSGHVLSRENIYDWRVTPFTVTERHYKNVYVIVWQGSPVLNRNRAWSKVYLVDLEDYARKNEDSYYHISRSKENFSKRRAHTKVEKESYGRGIRSEWTSNNEMRDLRKEYGPVMKGRLMLERSVWEISDFPDLRSRKGSCWKDNKISSQWLKHSELKRNRRTDKWKQK